MSIYVNTDRAKKRLELYFKKRNLPLLFNSSIINEDIIKLLSKMSLDEYPIYNFQSCDGNILITSRKIITLEFAFELESIVVCQGDKSFKEENNYPKFTKLFFNKKSDLPVIFYFENGGDAISFYQDLERILGALLVKPPRFTFFPPFGPVVS